MDNVIQQINYYQKLLSYAADSDLSNGECYPPFQQQESDEYSFKAGM